MSSIPITDGEFVLNLLFTIQLKFELMNIRYTEIYVAAKIKEL